jgi:ATP-dependent Lhr-like helicase
VISAPTGEGKTLAAFLAVIDRLVKRAIAGENIRDTRVLYVSPLKALSNDIEKNLQLPLAGIQRQLKAAGIHIDDIHAMVRTGDTSAADRAKLVRLRPQIVVTTPESLYLMLTSVSGRQMLETIETVIVDEIHALAQNAAWVSPSHRLSRALKVSVGTAWYEMVSPMNLFSVLPSRLR